MSRAFGRNSCKSTKYKNWKYSSTPLVVLRCWNETATVSLIRFMVGDVWLLMISSIEAGRSIGSKESGVISASSSNTF